MEKIMKNRPDHIWQCMHCKQMTDTYICSHCGKESYVKYKNGTSGSDEKIKTTESQFSKPEHQKINTTVPLLEIEIKGLKREVVRFAELINASVSGISKAIKSIACVFTVLFIVQAIMLAMNFNDTKKNIHNLEEANKELSALVHSQDEKVDNLEKTNKELSSLLHNQNEKVNSLEKAVSEVADSQIKYIVHTVEKGETLKKICKQYNIDFKAHRGIICSLNGINNPNIIRVGQKLLLPIFD